MFLPLLVSGRMGAFANTKQLGVLARDIRPALDAGLRATL